MAEYIEKEATLDRINRELRCGATADQCGLETAFELLCELPPADVRPVVRGRWIGDGDCIICSNCKTAYTFMGSNFCPNCGADMRGGDAE